MDVEVMVKVSEFEIAPPGLATVTVAVPAAAMRLAGTVAVNWAELTRVVVSVAPFQRTVEPDRKPWPFTVSVNCPPPAVAVAGLIDEIDADEAFVTVKVSAFEVVLVPLGFMTVTLAVPIAAIRLAGTTAVSWAALTKVVLSSPPFHKTVAPEAKLLPVTVNVNCGPPTVAVEGLNVVRLGVLGAPMVKDTAFDVVEPVTTVTLAGPAATSKVLDTDACNCVGPDTVVTSGLPFHCTVEAAVKPVPFTVMIKLPLPGVAKDGEMEVMAGPVGVAIVNVNGLEVPADGVVTVTLAVPALPIRLAGMLAVS